MHRAHSWKIIEYLNPDTKTTHAKEQAENGKWKINAETNSHGIKLSTRTSAFHQLFHRRKEPTPRNSTADQVSRKSFHQLF